MQKDSTNCVFAEEACTRRQAESANHKYSTILSSEFRVLQPRSRFIPRFAILNGDFEFLPFARVDTLKAAW